MWNGEDRKGLPSLQCDWSRLSRVRIGCVGSGAEEAEEPIKLYRCPEHQLIQAPLPDPVAKLRLRLFPAPVGIRP